MNTKIVLLLALLAISSFAFNRNSQTANVKFDQLVPNPKSIHSDGNEEFFVKDFNFQFFHNSKQSDNANEWEFLKNEHESLKYHIKMVNEYFEERLLNHPNINENIDAHQPVVKVILDSLDQPKDITDVTKIDESYEIKIKGADDHHQIQLKVRGYSSFLRALETLFQLFEKDLKFTHLPLEIQDEPSMKYRGVMYDTARHFFSIHSLERHIQGMRMNKLNVLHIHFTDSESFPVEIPLIPELSKYGAYSEEETYSLADILRLQHIAQINGVLLVPEFDTPGHTLSWTQSDKYAATNACPDYPPEKWGDFCNQPPCGNLDPTEPLTWELVEGVLNYTTVTFDSDIIHMGGDEVKYLCWDQKPSIKQYMNENGIEDYNALEAWFRKKQANYLGEDKRLVYWINGESLNLDFRPHDILQFWDEEKNYELLHKVEQDIVLSTYDYLYLDCGTGNPVGGNSWCDPFKTWLHIHNYDPRKANIGDRLIGVCAALWTELVTEGNLDSKIWPRAISLAMRLWDLDEHLSNQQLAQKIVTGNQRLRKQTGMESGSISSEYCELHTEMCFF